MQCKRLMVREKLYSTKISAFFLKAVFFLFLIIFTKFAYSTHIVGGALTYVYNGGSSYTITLKLYRDCAGAAFPDPVTVTVKGYNGTIFSPVRDFSMNLGTVTPVPSNLDTCADPPNPMPCVEEGIYTTTVNNLPPNPGGYHLYYQIIARNLSLTNIDATCNCIGESFYAYIPGYSVFWFEDFSLANGTTSDAGSTAWTRTLGTPAPGYARVETNRFEFSGADNASATWSSQVINISSYTSGVNLSVDLSENSGLEANDSIIIYYSLDGGPLTQFTTNGFFAGDFTNGVATVTGLVGSTIQVFAYVHYDGASGGEIYRADNVSVAEDNFQPNDNAVFTLFPPLFLCVGQSFSFDHSATDTDGDSLVYSFYTPYDGDNNTGPLDPVFSNNTATFQPIVYQPGYTFTNPLGGTPLNLNSSSGLLTGTPATLGQYVVGVLVKEYRNGICIDSTLRDFQFNVVNCPPPATAVLPDTISACSGLSVGFSNQGNPATSNWWNFGDPAVTNDTSVLGGPTYNYPLEGYYNVTLITNKGTFCADTDSAVVLVCWVDAGFVADTVGCAGDLYDFNDTSSASSNATIISYYWDFGDGSTSTAQDTTHVYTAPGTYTVTHIVMTDLGCSDTVITAVIVSPAPVFIIDMTGDPDSVWTSPSVVRDCRVCGSEDPNVCITFILTLDPGTQAISFDLTSGAVPPGALYYQINCGDSFPVGDTICIAGVGPHQITFCKPGNNPNEYTISAITAPEISPPVTVSEGCLDTVFATGYIESSITWTSVSPGVQGAYDSYLGCTSGCDTAIVTAQPGYPPSVDYMVCGLPQGGGSCSMTPVCDTTTVYFVSTLAAAIVPQNPSVCFGGTNATITANPSGGAVPYSYLWSTGATTASITVGAGTYFVTVSDTTDCQPVTDSVTVIAFASNITANAGADQVICAGSPSVSLSGTVTGVSTGTWSGGNGSFSPSNDSLNTTYTPTVGEISGGSVQLYLTTTNNGTCPSDTDTILITFNPVPTTANAGTDQIICGVTSATLSANSPIVGTGVWSIVSGTATITNPNSPSTTVTGLSAGSTYIFRWTISNGVCPPSTDDVTVTVDLSPTPANAGADQVLCNTTTAALAGNTPSVGIGSWSVITGTATITSPNSPSSTVTGLVIGGSCTLRWTITQGSCTSSDDVTITVDQLPTTANAGPDQALCNISSAALAGNTATIGSGMWSVVSGTATVTTPASPNSTVTGLITGTSVTLLWTISNGVCPPSTDDVIITIYTLPTTANAGTDQTICATSATLSANTPTSGTGTWSIISGAATITNPSAANTTVTGLTAGSSYTLRWTISNGVCPPSTDDVVINVDVPPTTANAGPDQTICDASATLSANVPSVGTGVWSIVSGTATITNPNSVNTTVTGLTAGSSYTFQWTISNGTCPVSTDLVVINVDIPPTTADAGPDQTICDASATLSANVPSVGTGVWSVVSGTATITNPNSVNTTVTGLTAGSSYTFQWTISNGTCPPSTDLVVINVDVPPTTADAGPDQIVCGVTSATLSANTPSSGTGIWSVISGTATITSPGSPVTSVTGLSAGSTYIFQWMISSGVCPPSADSVTINVDLTPTTANAGTDQVLCNVTNSTLSANTPSVGNGLWSLVSGTATIASPALPSSSITGLVPGDTAYFQWTISQGVCTNSDIVYVFIDDFDSVLVSNTNVSCFGGNDGTASAVPVNGNSPYTFQWSDGQTDSIATVLLAGIYDITVTDANGCLVFSSITITQPSLLVVTIDSSVNVSCYGGNNGMAMDATIGGTSPYTYLWSNGSTGSSAQNLQAGTYIITATDSNGCTASDTITISEPAFALSADPSSTSVFCKGGNNGTATAVPSGGTSPYSYLWDASAGSQTDSTATGLVAGTYNVTVTDSNNCTFDTMVTVVEPATFLALDTSSTLVVCNGGDDGTATVTPSGGVSPYTYLWDANANSQTDSTATGLVAGSYSVTVTDNNNCVIETIVFVDQPFSPLSIAISVDSVKCFGGSDGSATVTPSGGTSPYSYTWDDSSLQTDSIADGLTAGTYNVTVTDNTGNCKVGNDLTVLQPDSMILNPSSMNVSCFGGNDGSASVAPAGGTSPYTFIWNTNQVTSQISNLSSQVYSVTITDNNGCSDSVAFNLTEPSAPLSISSLVFSNVNCNGGNDGTAEVSVSGGTVPYSFLWNDPNQTIASSVTGLYAGSYSVTITDTNNCFIDTTVTISEPFPGLTVAISATDVNCFGGNDGTATITPSGGTPPYFYQWDANANSQTDSTATGLTTGTYSVTVTDNNGCILDTNSAVFVGQPATYISVNISQNNVACNGDSTANATLSVSGGTPPYTYLWEASTGSQTDSIATGLASGTYNATVTDNNGCADDTIAVSITEPPPLVLTLTSTDVICKGENNGTATITPSGGTFPYTYQWDAAANSQTDSTATGLIAGTYTATVTDFNGCINDSAFFTIDEPADSLSLATSFTDVSCFGDSNGTATVTPYGGWTPYSYQWSSSANSQTDSTATGLKAGTYSVIVSDNSGCTDSSVSVTVLEPQTVVATATQNDTICPGENATISVTGTGGVSPYAYEWNIGSGQSQTVSPSSNTIYTVTITDDNNCESIADSVTVFVRNYYFDSLVFSCGTAVNCVLCPGGSTQISATYYEEFPPYSYLWFGLGNGLGPFTVSPGSTTDYILKVSDQCGSFQDTLTIVVDSFPVIDVLAVSPGCEPHTVTFENSVQNPPGSTYKWNFGDGSQPTNDTVSSSPTHSYPNDGSYNVSLIIITPNNCSDTAINAATVTVYPEPEPVCSASPVIATLQNPVINFETGDFTSYLWDFDDGDTSSAQSPIHTYRDSGDYTVTVFITNQYDCENTCEISVRINPLYPLGIPNAFTPDPNGPNGGVYSFDDFTNNIFFPITRYVTDFRMEIFNRWGELLFVSTDIKTGWDGYYRGMMCQQDVYVWKIYLKWWDGQEFNEVGDVTLLR